MHLTRASQDFLQGYFSTHIRQAKTKSAYASDMAQFVTYAGRKTDLCSLSNIEIEKWVSYLKNNNYSPASIRRKVVVLKLFFSYWVRKGVVSESPFWRVQVHYGRITQLPRALTEKEMQTLLKQTQSNYLQTRKKTRQESTLTIVASDNYRALRNIAILEVFFATGMRVGEVSAININDVSSSESSIKVQGKGGKERMAFVVDKFALKILMEYMNIRGNICSSSSAFFLNSSGTRLSSQGIANIIKQLRSESGIERHITPHMLRHTVATLLLRNGVDIRVVQEFLGHASITTTQRYTHVTKEHMIRELRNRHPSLSIRGHT